MSVELHGDTLSRIHRYDGPENILLSFFCLPPSISPLHPHGEEIVRADPAVGVVRNQLLMWLTSDGKICSRDDVNDGSEP